MLSVCGRSGSWKNVNKLGPLCLTALTLPKPFNSVWGRGSSSFME